MGEYKPRIRTQLVVLATFLVLVLPAIWFSGMGYIWFLETGLKLDLDKKSEGFADGLLMLATVFPIIPVMMVGILAAGIPWMFLMSRYLSWAEIQYYTKQKGPRMPLLAEWLDRLWERMIESRRTTTLSAADDFD